MKILYLFGNGFDISRHIKTSYENFCNYYQTVQNDDEVIIKFKKAIKSSPCGYWSDFEKELGNYTINLNSFSELSNICQDVNNNLKEYLTEQMNSYAPSDMDKISFLNGLLMPEQYFRGYHRRKIYNIFKSNNDILDYDFVSFNYTNTLERIFKYKITNNTITYPSFQLNDDVLHIHGILSDQDIIFGVDNIEQIKNPNLRNDDAKNLMVKPAINSGLRNLNDVAFADYIQNADVICMFGISLGITDLTWWKIIGDKMVNSFCELLYFPFFPDFSPHNSQLISNTDNSYKLLFNMMNISSVVRKSLSERIHISPNTKIFQF